MKNRTSNLFVALALLALSILNYQFSTAHAQGTAFTYQGQLQNNGSPASGTYNLTFSLYATNTTGVAIAGPVTNNAVIATNGLFTVLIDFGPGVFTGAANWLQIGVETNGASPFTTLAPRQQLTPVPYAIFANTASNVSGTVSAAQLTGAVPGGSLSGTYGNAVTLNNAGDFFSGSFSGNGSGLINLNVSAAQLTGGANNNVFVGPSGNSTTSGANNTANGFQALHANTTGSSDTANGFFALHNNTTGAGNTADGVDALNANTLGSFNTANGDVALNANTIGTGNTADGGSTLNDNTIGSDNTANGFGALYSNSSGSNNIALGYEAGFYITTGSSNIDIGNQGFSSDVNLIRIGSGQSQTFIAGVINGNGGGLTNVSVGALNGLNATNFWQTTGNSGTTPGVNFVGTTDNQPLELHVNGLRALRLEPVITRTGPLFTSYVNVIGGAPDNFVLSGVGGATIGGGGSLANIPFPATSNSVTANFGTVGGGTANTASGYAATVGGGESNTDSGLYATVGGGLENTASGTNSTIGGGFGNYSCAIYAMVGGGQYNFATGTNSTVGGGYGNEALGQYSAVGGGYGNTAYIGSHYCPV